MDHLTAVDLLGVYALDACDADEAVDVERHLAECVPCATDASRMKELAGWIGVSESASPSAGLRSALLRTVGGDQPIDPAA